jgi:hypothetical protein
MALLFAAAAFVPLDVMAANPLDIGHPERLIAVIALVWSIATGMVLVLVRRGVRSSTAVSGVFLVVVLIMAGSSMPSRLGIPFGLTTIGILAGGAIVLIARMESHRLLEVLVFSLAAFLLAGPVIALTGALLDLGDDVSVTGEPHSIHLTRKPDMFVIVLDGYIGRRGLAADFGLDDPDVFAELERRGFEAPESAWSSYTSTRSSVASLLDMSYPIGPGPGLTPATNRHLSDMIGGSNTVSSILHGEGYETVMIESGWSGSRCGEGIDMCISAPILDEATFKVLERSAAGPSILGSFGYSFTVGSLNTMKWLLANGPRLSADDRPSLVLAHIMAPHAPFFLNRNCETVVSSARGGVAFAREADDLEGRVTAYLEQAGCLDNFAIDLADRIEPDDVVVFVGDHGTDQRGQMTRHPSTWGTEDVAERFNVFLAVRAGPGCRLRSPVILPNVFRRILSCLSDGEPIGDLEPRMLMYAAGSFDGEPSPVLELEHQAVIDLIGS